MLHDGNGGLIGSRYILVVGGLHLELVHGLACLGDVQTVAGGIAAGVAGVIAGVVGIVVAHGRSLLFSFREAFTSRRP